MARAKKLPAFSVERRARLPRCEGVYVPPHPTAGTKCVSTSRYSINGKNYCTTHAKEESLRILLEE